MFFSFNMVWLKMDINYIQLIMANVYVYEVIMESKAPKVFSLTRRRLPLVQLFKT